jgi:hypothetical protein
MDVHLKDGCAPVAQMDRAIASGAIGREFESLRAHQILNRLQPIAILAKLACSGKCSGAGSFRSVGGLVNTRRQF